MYFLRFVRNKSHFSPVSFDAGKAARQLIDREGGLLSVYEVESIDVAKRVATLYAMSGKMQPEDVDFILLPLALVQEHALAVVVNPGDVPHQICRDRHRELTGLNQANRDQIVVQIRDHVGAELLHRLKKADIKPLCVFEINDPLNGQQARDLIAAKPKWIAEPAQ